jgi:hypothetical protein
MVGKTIQHQLESAFSAFAIFRAEAKQRIFCRFSGIILNDEPLRYPKPQRFSIFTHFICIFPFYYKRPRYDP